MATSQEELEALRRLAEIESAKVKPSVGQNLKAMLGGAKKVGADLLSGFGQVVAEVPRIAGHFQFSDKNAAALYKEADTYGKKARDFGAKYGLEPGYGKAITQSVGSIGAAPGGVTSLAGLRGALGGGVGAGAAQQAATDFDPDNLPLQIAATLVGGMTGGFLAGPKQSVGRRDIRLELQNTPEADWAAAAKTIEDFKGAGAKTATLAEAFPGKTGIKALANRAANAGGGELLRQQLAGRSEDLAALTEAFKRRINPNAVDENAVANQTTGAANAYIQNLKGIRTQATGDTMRGDVILPQYVKDMQTNLYQIADSLPRQGPAEAYRAVADSLQGQHGILTNTQELSFALKSMKPVPGNPNAVTFAGRQFDLVDLTRAIQDAETGLAQLSPKFDRAMQDYRGFTDAAITPTRQGPIGTLSDRNPVLAGQTAASKLPGLVENNSPDTIRNVAASLADPAATQGQPANLQEIARAIAQMKLRMGSETPGQAMRGLQGSDAESRFNALLDAAGKNVDEVNQPLRAADAMDLGSASSISQLPQMRAMQGVLRPFRTADMMMTASTEKNIQREIAQLLANPTPEALAELRRIAMFDPTARALVSSISGLLPQSLLASEEEN